VIFYLDNTRSVANDGAAFADGVGYSSLGGLPTPHTLTSGNTYRFKRGQTWNLTQPIVTAALAASQITVHAYYNADGTDDAAQAKPRFSNVVDSSTSDWSNSGDTANMWYSTSATVGNNRRMFFGLIGNTVYPSRDPDDTESNGSWAIIGLSGTDIPSANGEWVRNGSFTGSTNGNHKIYRSGGINPASASAFGGSKPKICSYSATWNGTTYNCAALHIDRPLGGVHVYDLDFSYVSVGINLDCGTAAGLYPNTVIRDCNFAYSRSHIMLRNGSATNTTGWTGLQIYNNRMHMCSEAAISTTTATRWCVLNGGATIETGASCIRDNVISYACQAVGLGAIYMPGTKATGTDRAWIAYNSISYTQFGRVFAVDGIGIYLENDAGNFKIQHNFLWECAAAFESKPGSGLTNEFKYNVSIPLTAATPLAAQDVYQTFMVAKNPDDGLSGGTSYTSMQYNMSFGHRSFLLLSRDWDESVDIEVGNCWAKGKNIAATNASAIKGNNQRIATMVAPVTDCHFYNFSNAAAKNWYADNTTNTVLAPANEAAKDAGERTGTSDGTVWFDNLDTADNTAVLTNIYNKIGGSSPSNIETHYARMLGSSFWSQYDPSVAPGAGTVTNRASYSTR